MNKDIKQKAREMFHLCGGITSINETPEEYRKRVDKVLDSIIDLAIKEREGEIVEMIKLYKKTSSPERDDEYILKIIIDEIISLTNSKE